MHEIPAIEKYSDPAYFAQFTDNPEARASVQARHEHATNICNYLIRPSRSTLNSYFDHLSELLAQPENTRLALYIPLDEFTEAPKSLKLIYLAAWRNCLKQEDVRENFNQGDSLEVSARGEGFAYVVKAAHLIPWLLKAHILQEEEVFDLLESGSISLIQSICDCWEILAQKRFLASAELRAKIQQLREAYPRHDCNPLYNSPERQRWLIQRDHELWGSTIPHNVCGPFSLNFKPWLMPQPQGNDILLIGGSNLKGYSSTVSDIDTYHYEAECKQIRPFCSDLNAYRTVPDQNIAHICLDTVWFSYRADLQTIHDDCIREYLNLSPDSLVRKQSIERLEQDLLQYRLMHKGIRRIYECVSMETKNFSDIDGSSAFYDRHYRRIATQLFAKYVFLPQI